MSPFQFSNEAISLLQNGRYEESIRPLQAALSNVKSLLQQSSGVKSSAHRKAEELMPVPCLRTIDINDNEGDKDADFPSVCRAFRFDDSDDSWKQFLISNENAESLVTSLMLFNFALCHHSLATGSNNGKLSVALKLYRLALYSLEGIVTSTISSNGNADGSMFDSRQEATIFVLWMAILNNMANIHSRLCDFEAARRAKTKLTEILSEYGGHQIAQQYYHEECLFFGLNTIIQETLWDLAPAA